MSEIEWNFDASHTETHEGRVDGLMSASHALREVICLCGHSEDEHDYLGKETCNNVEQSDNLWIVCPCGKFLPK